LAKYLRNPQLRAVPLVPLAILGSVGAPGYYYLSADLVLRDVVMRAGGPAPSGDIRKTVVRRGGETIWNVAQVRTAMADGLSVDQLHLRAGDEIFIPEERRYHFTTVLTVLSSSMALAIAFVQLRRH